MLPKLYGQDIRALFKQKYHGDVTIVPDMKIEEKLGVKAIMHPSAKDMNSYIQYDNSFFLSFFLSLYFHYLYLFLIYSGGRKATWPHLLKIKHLLLFEST